MQDKVDEAMASRELDIPAYTEPVALEEESAQEISRRMSKAQS